MGLSTAVDQLAGGVEQAVAEAFGFNAGEVPVEGDEACPGEQIMRDSSTLTRTRPCLRLRFTIEVPF